MMWDDQIGLGCAAERRSFTLSWARGRQAAYPG